MHTSVHPNYNPLIRKLESIFTLTEDERQALGTLPMQVSVIKENQGAPPQPTSRFRVPLSLGSGIAQRL